MPRTSSCPPSSTYGFQKLASEYFAKGAHEQYGLPFTIIRPFNCVGVGERRALRDSDVMSGNVRLAMSHVVPDLVQKVLKGQDPLHILGDGSQVRHYTYGGDLARGIRLAIESERALNEDFNLSTARSTTVRELAEIVWRKIQGKDRPLRVVSDRPYEHDVQMRVPDVAKARDVLGFEATTPLEEVLDEVRPGLRAARGPFVLITMGDGSDDPADIDHMYALARGGADVVAGSRYMRGGRQLGGPLLKRTMSRAAGLSLHWLGGLPIHDATSNFRLYSKRLLNQVTIESTGGFELGIELTVKAYRLGMRVAEVPTTWSDRTAGQSRFRLLEWLPRYLHWYWRGMAGRLVINR